MSDAPLGAVLRHLRSLAALHRYQDRSDGELLRAFAATRDQDAFAALVKRHGPLVLGVCRRVLHHAQDAEDAFQATFLLLARKAGSIRKQASLASWLHGVAYRMAHNARRSAARRQRHEGQARPAGPVGPEREAAWREVQALLDEEIQRLPERYRTPFILCTLEGYSPGEVARRLGVKGSTVTSWLSRARELLRKRLARRGVELSLVLTAVAVSSAPAAVPGALVAATVEAAVLYAAQGAGATASVAALLKGVHQAMVFGKVKAALFLVLAVAVAGTGVGGVAYQRTVARATEKQAQPASAERTAIRRGPSQPAVPDPPRKEDTLVYGGRVLAPDGQPVAGAKLYLSLRYARKRPALSPEVATTGPDGRFRFTVPKARFHDQVTVVTAAAANHGAGWVEVPADGQRDELTLRLVHDDVPITGQVVDLEGKPIPGATLSVREIHAAPGEDLGPWLEAAQGRKGPSLKLRGRYFDRYTIALPLHVATDPAGCFRLVGIGRNRLVIAQLDGPAVASQHLHILTRPLRTIEVTEFEGIPQLGEPRTVTTYYGASFQHVAAPTKPIVGVVRDKATKKPLAGVLVRSFKMAHSRFHLRDGEEFVRTTTDAQGRYRLTGMPKGEGNKIEITPPAGLPYGGEVASVPDSPGFNPVTVDVELKRGIWIEGRITDKVTGKPLTGSVRYFPLETNPNEGDYGCTLEAVDANEDGAYRVVGMPGPGLVAVDRIGYYLGANERDDEDGVPEASLPGFPISYAGNFSALARIDPAKGLAAVKRDVTLDPGWTFTGTVLGPDGKPLAGVLGFGVGGFPLKTAAFTVRAFHPRRSRNLIFQYPEKGLVGVVRPPKENGGTVTVQMEPGLAVTGRLVDADGKPRSGVELQLSFSPKKRPASWEHYPHFRLETDKDGRFRFDALLPGHLYRLSDGEGVLRFGSELRAGQRKDFGDVCMKRVAE
jgi:RNA polymerase sigma factor (sigma-70 family)